VAFIACHHPKETTMAMRFSVSPVPPLERRRNRVPAALLRLAAGALLLGVVFLFMLASDPARASDQLVRFEGGIGSQVWARNNATGAVVNNDVFGVLPGGRPWVIDRLSADVTITGQIRVDGRGLLLAGGNAIGGNGNQTVRARLFCGGVAHDSDEAVALDPRGDFRIGGFLTPRPPTPCTGAVLLIINVPAAGNPAWFAAGIPKL
jgi:hypothetical protein